MLDENNIGSIGNFKSEEFVQPAQPAAKACLVLGIISVATMLISGIGVFPGIASVIVGLAATQRGNDSKTRTVGMLLGVIGAIVSIITLLGYMLAYSCFPEVTGGIFPSATDAVSSALFILR